MDYWYKKYQNVTSENIDRLTADLNKTDINTTWWGPIELSKLYGSLTNNQDYLIREKINVTPEQAQAFNSARRIISDKILQKHQEKYPDMDINDMAYTWFGGRTRQRSKSKRAKPRNAKPKRKRSRSRRYIKK